MTRRRTHTGTEDGFTLIEVTVVLVLLALLAAYAAPRLSATGSTIDFQADLLARNLRHAQALALSRSLPLQVTVVGNTYSVVCTQVLSPCVDTVSAITDPATGTAFAVTLDDGVGFTSSPATPVYFDRLGNPAAGVAPVDVTQSYQLSDGAGQTRTVRLAPLGGLVSVTNP